MQYAVFFRRRKNDAHTSFLFRLKCCESLGRLGKGKQPESQAESSIDKSKDKGLDFSDHPFLTGGSIEGFPGSLKVGSLKEFKRIVRDTREGEKWYRFFSAIAEYDNDLYVRGYHNQKKAAEYKKLANDRAADLQNAEENWTHDRIAMRDAQRENKELRAQLEESHRRQREATSASTLPDVTRNYRPIGINPSEPLKGTDANEYNTWAYAIREKLETDEPLYPNDKRKVRYALSQMKDPIFDVMHSWVFDVGNGLTLDLFFKEIENYMGIHHLLNCIQGVKA